MPKQSEATPVYRRIVADAWRIAWVHKHLWMFGFFATFLGLGGISEVLLGVYDRTIDTFSLAPVVGPAALIPGLDTVRAIIAFSSYPAVSLLIFLVVSLAFLAVFVWIISVAASALIASINKIEKGSEPTFSEGLKLGAPLFGKVFGISLLSKLIIGAAFLFTGINLAVLLADATVTSALFYLGSYVAFTIIALLAAVTAVYATMFAVIDGKPMDRSWSEGWKLTKEHWLINIEMAVVLLMVNIGLAVIALVAAMIVSIPLIFLFAVAVAVKAGPLMTVVMSLTAIVLIAVIVLITSFLTTFQLSAWMLIWKQLTGGKPASRIMRAAHRVRSVLGL